MVPNSGYEKKMEVPMAADTQTSVRPKGVQLSPDAIKLSANGIANNVNRLACKLMKSAGVQVTDPSPSRSIA